MEETRKRGRPPGKEFPVKQQLRMTPEEHSDLAKLAGYWRMTKAATARRAIAEALEREETRQAKKRKQLADPPEATSHE